MKPLLLVLTLLVGIVLVLPGSGNAIETTSLSVYPIPTPSGTVCIQMICTEPPTTDGETCPANCKDSCVLVSLNPCCPKQFTAVCKDQLSSVVSSILSPTQTSSSSAPATATSAPATVTSAPASSSSSVPSSPFSSRTVPAQSTATPEQPQNVGAALYPVLAYALFPLLSVAYLLNIGSTVFY